MTSRTRVFSGIRPTGEVHLGNYFGALQNWVRMTEKYDCIYGVVDYHAITTPFEPADLPTTVFNTMASLMAVGLSSENCSLVVQTDIPEHTELAWILSCIAPLGQMERMTQFKEKSQQSPENINLGLLAYPALMAADILIYRAEAVPVGEDQVQHLELARDLARKFTNSYGEYLLEPDALLTDTPRIMGLDGKRKMSKSLGNHISLFEPADSLQKKLRGAVTDENRKLRKDPGDPDVCNIFSLHKIYSSTEEVESINKECRTAEIGCVDCKKMLLSHVEPAIAPFRTRYVELQSNKDEVYDAIKTGAERCRPIAQETVAGVKQRIGLGQHLG